VESIGLHCPRIAGSIDHYAFVQRFSSPTKGEVSPLLYSRNCVTLQECAILTSFIDHIGPQNASFLRHICIPFPAFDNYHFGSVTLKKDSIRTLKRIRDNCTNLVALKTSLHFRMIIAMESAMDFDSPQAAAALALVEARFKAILLEPTFPMSFQSMMLAFQLISLQHWYLI